MVKKLAIIGLLGITMGACSILENGEQKESTSSQESNRSQASRSETPYQPTAPQPMDLVHTKLDVKPDWKQQYLQGKAELTFTPHFYPQDTLAIDAKGFDLHKVQIISNGKRQNVDYRYDTQALVLDFNKTYHKTDTLKVYIDYTAKPRELQTEGSDAITGAQGLYFINPEGSQQGIPQQIWTQGEPEASSCWFPTIDHPNQKTTQEISITVDTSFETLSNGTKSYSILNDDGTRTDKWKMTKPHAPYLFMMAIGNFAIVEDEWRGKEVNYYVTPEYKEHARMIFGRTPEMMTLYSELFDYEYPWPKYSQVPVRDFVAGAMENTTATIHFSGIQHNKREHIDRDFESLIAHELIHHWFGNLVTCESWANLALNESFATYGQHLWFEHAYGDAREAMSRQSAFRSYLNEARSKKRPLIQHRYERPVHLFDRHRYQKGSLILHMLRDQVGDSAFFAGINQYLEDRAYRPAEYHHLRLAMEEVTGRDLNQFFDQWFESAGHPKLRLQTQYDTDAQKVRMIVEQTQDTEQFPVFQLPVAVDVYQNGRANRHQITIKNQRDTFYFPAVTRPDLVNFDARKALLAEVDHQKSPEEWFYQYNEAPLYLDLYQAIEGIRQYVDSINPNQLKDFFKEVLKADFYGIRKHGFTLFGDIANHHEIDDLKSDVTDRALNDASAEVRNKAFQSLGNFESGQEVMNTYRKGLRDSSYKVVRTALQGMAKRNPDEALNEAQKLERADNDQLLYLIGKLYAKHGGKQEGNYIKKMLQKPGFEYRYRLSGDYVAYLKRMDLESKMASVSVWQSMANNAGKGSDQNIVQNNLKQFLSHLKDQIDSIEENANEEQSASNEKMLLEELVQELKGIEK